MSTLSVLRSRVRAETKKDPNGKVWSDSEVNNAVNQAVFQIQSDTSFGLPETQTSTTVSVWPSGYNIPSTWAKVDKVYYWSNELLSVDYTTVAQFTDTTSSPSGYSIYGWILRLHGIPTWALSVLVVFSSDITQMSADGDTCILPNEYDRAITLFWAYILMSQFSQFFPEASAKKTMYDSEVSRLIMKKVTMDNGQLIYGQEKDFHTN